VINIPFAVHISISPTVCDFILTVKEYFCPGEGNWMGTGEIVRIESEFHCNNINRSTLNIERIRK
jgi:hypothetical protein